MLWLLAKGYTATTIAESTGYTRYWIGQIAKRYNAQGPADTGDMVNRQHTTLWHASRMLSDAQREELRQGTRKQWSRSSCVPSVAAAVSSPRPAWRARVLRRRG